MHAHKLDFNSMSKNVILLIVAITKQTKIKHFSNQRLLHDFIRKILSTLSTTKVFFFKSLTNKNKINLLHFVAFFHVASLFSTGVDNKKVGVDNEKALELTNSTVFHRGRQQKSSRAGQQNIFSYFSLVSM